MAKLTLFLLWFIVGTNTNAQNKKDIVLHFNATYGDNKVVLNESITENDLFIRVLKFYISNVTLSNNDKHVYEEKLSYHLIDFSIENDVKVTLENAFKKSFNTLSFNLGIDSLTNASGVHGGDLDPTKGMYWSWQSGYINFKFEGEKINNGISTPFQYHLGGYKGPYNSIAKVKLDVDYKSEIEIKFNVSLFLKLLNKVETQKIMSPSLSSVKCMQYVAKCFYI